MGLPPRRDGDVHGTWVDRYDPNHSAAIHVVKIHDPNEALAWRSKAVVTSRRDLRDIAASAWKRGWISDETSALALLDSVVAQHAWWSSRCAFEMVYERMRSDPRSELAMLAAALAVQADASAIEQVERRIDALGHDESSEADFDAANLMHKRHIMDGRVGYHAQTLPAALLATINVRYSEWLRNNGYAA